MLNNLAYTLSIIAYTQSVNTKFAFKQKYFSVSS
nr:MAG TPA: hypothetical protein [Caudoviricetes sp.]DAP19882.1 MAG TPA: hypothetical protein [Caudoviricetes sp.]DAX58155.1 MAG TPA: hypothetical protein [Caudoviricetes sp.]